MAQAAIRTRGARKGAIERKSLDEDIADRLRSLILKGDLQPGERLTELGLADRWQVSQGTIRAALKTLQHEGLVENLPRRGTFVASVGEEDVLEIYTLRDTLEAFAARRAAQRMTDAGRKALEKVMRDMRAAAQAGNRKQMLDLDFQFHRTIVNMCEHRRLSDIYSALEVQTRLFLTMTEVLHHDLDEALAQHEPLAEAILAGDAERAFALASHHSERDAVELVNALFQDARTGNAT